MIDFLKKIWSWVTSIPQDKLLHDYAGALIALFSFVLLFLFLQKWADFAWANVITVVLVVGKEIYDFVRPEGHSVECKDIAFGVFGLLKVDIALLLLFISL